MCVCVCVRLCVPMPDCHFPWPGPVTELLPSPSSLYPPSPSPHHVCSPLPLWPLPSYFQSFPIFFPTHLNTNWLGTSELRAGGNSRRSLRIRTIRKPLFESCGTWEIICKCVMSDLKGLPPLNASQECTSIDNEITYPLLLEILMKAFCNRKDAGVTRKQLLRNRWGKAYISGEFQIVSHF